jgi:hypothetical protein
MTDKPAEIPITRNTKYLLGKLVEDQSIYGQYQTQFIFDPRYAHHFPLFTHQVIQTMLLDSRIRYGLSLIKGPILTYTKFFNSEEAESPSIHQAIVELNYHFPYGVQADDEKTEEFIIDQLNRFWEVGLSKALTAIEYGYSGSEVKYKNKSTKEGQNMMTFDNLYLYKAYDLQCITKRGGIVGFTRNHHKNSFVPLVKGFWHIHQREKNQFYGESHLKGAHIPWHENWTLGGARDIRRTWFFKNAYDGGELYYPDGSYQDETGRVVPNEELALQMLEMKRAGSAMVFPSTKGLDGKRQWEYEPPKANVTPTGMAEYIDLLRDEMLEGLGIPPEVVQSSGNDGMGSATGRLVPFMAFIASLTPIATYVIGDFCEQILNPLLIMNKMSTEYRIRRIVPKSEQPEGSSPVQEKTVQDTGAAGTGK